MRGFTACSVCRSRRRKCEIPPGGVSCTYCLGHSLQCTKSKDPALGTTVRYIDRPIVPTSSERSATLPPQALCIELVGLYFDLIHDQFHSLFHRPSFMASVRKGDSPPVILFAMMALSARFSTNPAFSRTNPWARSGRYAKESALLLDLRDLSLTTIQACVLLGAVSRTEAEGGAESVYYSVACRIANLLDLANKQCVDSLEREINLRVWWTLCKIDVWSSAGVGLPRQMIQIDTVPLPMDEEQFLHCQHEDDNLRKFYLAENRESSLLAQMIILNTILIEIHDFHQQLLSRNIDETAIGGTVERLSRKLDDWHDTLPAHLRDIPENLRRHASKNLGRMFVAVHVGYYHFGQLLFYGFLQEGGLTTDPESRAHSYASKCKAYAAGLCNIVYAAASAPHCKVLYTSVGANIVIASAVQIHTLLFSSDEKEIAAARFRLERNFAILTEMRTYWPVLEVTFERFRTFREACRTNMDTAFRMDQWILRFLYGLAKPIEDKQSYDAANTELRLGSDIGISPGDWRGA